MYDLAALQSALAGTVFAGKLHFLPSTGSTNTDAMNAARAGVPHGSVFFADEQTAGRGRGGHTWHSVVGQGLYASVVVRLPLAPARLPLLPLAAGLAAAEAVRIASGLTIDLRWPNDLLIGARKTGGILVEAGSQSEGLPHAVVGIGINVHQRSFDPSLATPGTSLDVESGRTVDRQQLLIALLEFLDGEMRGLLYPTACAAIPSRLAAASTWIRGRNVVVHGPQACAGITEGLDENGFLLVRTSAGLVQVQTGGIRDAEV